MIVTDYVYVEAIDDEQARLETNTAILNEASKRMYGLVKMAFEAEVLKRILRTINPQEFDTIVVDVMNEVKTMRRF